jgi:hypothetical protein
MQVGAWLLHELEHHAARQRFGPKKLVVSAERRTPNIRILSRGRVRPKIERDVS